MSLSHPFQYRDPATWMSTLCFPAVFRVDSGPIYDEHVNGSKFGSAGGVVMPPLTMLTMTVRTVAASIRIFS